MAIRRYVANADNTISNAFKDNLSTRATGSNMGQADVSEVFSIYARATTSSAEISRVLTKFDVSSISSDRTAGVIPSEGDVSFYLRLYNAETTKTVPKNFKIVVSAISRSWSEGDGMDLENYRDLDSSNWISASQGIPWNNQGGDYHASPRFEQSFETGLEDLDINVTSLVEEWIAGTKTNYGFGVQLTASQEASSSLNSEGVKQSYYTKRFFARGTQYFFKKPVIEARWNSSTQDDRGDFFYSSSLAPASDNLNTIYLYNFVRGRLTNIPAIGTGNIFVNLYSGSTSPTGSKLVLHDGKTNVTGGFVSTGIYSCSVSITSATTPLKTLFDVWHNDSATQYFTGTIKPAVHYAAAASTGNTRYVTVLVVSALYRRR